MQCRTHNRPQCCSINHSTASHQSVESGSGSRSAWRSSIPHGIDLHTRTPRGTYVLADLVYSFALFPCSSCLLACLSLPRPALPCKAMHIRACHAMPRLCHALPRPCLSLVAPNPPSLRLTFPQSPVQPSRRSAHKQDFTWVSELLQPKRPVPLVLCPVLFCKVGAQPGLPACQSASLPISACLATSSLCVMPDSIRFACFALLFNALPCLAGPCSPDFSNSIPSFCL